MPKVGIRELKNDTSEILRAVREEKIAYTVTYRGEPVAVIQPVDTVAHGQSATDLLTEARLQDDYWARLDALAAEIDASWTSDKTAVELIEKQRRDL